MEIRLRDMLNPPNMITIGNGIMGLLAIFYAINNEFKTASVLILIGMVFDYLDGKVARIIKSRKRFDNPTGRQFDSLADIVTFGVAPAVMGMIFFNQWWQIMIILFFFSAGIMRLARFNVIGCKGGFIGTPITINGFVFPMLYLFFPMIPYGIFAYLILGITMISPIRISKLR